MRPRKPSWTTTSGAPGTPDDVGDLVAGVAAVGRHEHAAGVRHGEGGDGPLDAVGRPDDHPVAGLETEPDVAARRLPDLVEQARVAQRALALDVRRPVAVSLRGGAQHGRERAR